MKWNMSISKTSEGNITFEHLSTSSQVKITVYDARTNTNHYVFLDYSELGYLMEIFKRIDLSYERLLNQYELLRSKQLDKGKSVVSI